MTQIDLAHVWKKVLDKIFFSLDPQTQELWVSPIVPKELKDNILVLNAPNKYFEDWIVSGGYKIRIEELVSKELNLNIEVKFNYMYDIKDTKKETVSSEKSDFEYSPEKIFVLKESFNPNYTFDEFITDESNRFAKAVCETASKEPGVAYNPIFIYAPVGLGKTHLLHAVGNKMLEMSKKFRIAYISASKFVSDFVTAIQNNRLDIFRSKFQNAVALLLDDVQFLIEKEKSQEEFFQVFNMLFDMKKQIVITSDRKPQELKGIEERLISRFEWGVVADIGKPSLELRLAILRHKAKKQKVYVPDDVLKYIAENITENIRRIEGALIRILARSLTENIPLTVDTVKEMLKDMVEPQPKTVGIEKIISVIEDELKVSRKELLSKKRSEALVLPRQFGMYLAKVLTDLSYSEISESFGRKDHTTSYHAYLKIKSLISSNPYYAQIVNKMITRARQ